jgi:hypothetical protein
MRVLILALALTLAACAEPPAVQPEASPAPAAAAPAPAPPAITGAFTAMSTTAMGVTGDLDITPDVLWFARGFRIEGGRIDASLGPNTDLSAGGGTIADGSGNTSVTEVELRRVENVRIAADARNPTLCGGATVTHVILARGADALSVLMFSGADAPGPNAHDTQLCGIYNYFPA